MTYAGCFGLPQSGIIVRADEGPLRLAAIAFDARRVAAQTEEQDLRSLLREVIAIRRAGAKG